MSAQARVVCWGLCAVCLMIGVPMLVTACPMCKDALLDPGQAATQSRVAQGYALSIAALLGIPVMFIGGVAAWVVMAARRVGRRVDTPVDSG